MLFVVAVVSLFVVVVLVDPSAYVVSDVLSYPPVILVLDPDVLVCVFVSSASAAPDNNIIKIIKYFTIPPH